jgi:hypothetical protein
MYARLTTVAKSFENRSIFALAVICHVAFAVINPLNFELNPICHLLAL